MNLTQAQAIAAAIVYELAPHCQRCIVAGSVRREVPQVKDIEVVALPTFIIDSLFDFEFVVCPEYRLAVKSLGTITKGQFGGRYMAIQLPEIKLDIFTPQPADFYRQVAIRTGSADYVRRVIAGGWVRAGWVGTPDGLRLREECKHHKQGWLCAVEEPDLPPVWESEEAFFEWIGVEWIPPRDRKY